MAKKNNDSFKTKKVINLSLRVLNEYYRSALADCTFEPKSKTDEDREKEFLEFLKKQIIEKPNQKFLFITDYTRDILKEAKKYRDKKMYELSCLFYAIWFEHFINDVIKTLAKKNKLTDKDLVEIIRNTNFTSKITWLLKLFKLPDIYYKHRRNMEKIIEFRNAFVHYKWIGKKEDDLGKHKKDLRTIVDSIDKTVTYLKKYHLKNVLKVKRVRFTSTRVK